MPLDPVVNFFRSQIATLPLASGGATMVITTGDGNKLPNPATDGAFNLVIYNANDPFVTPEIVRVTAKSGDSLTITRAQEGTTATNKTAGNTWFVELVNTAKMIQNIDTNKVEKTGDTMTGTLTATKLIPSGNVTAGNGMYLPAANTLAIGTNGTEAIRVNASQNTGFGVTAPASRVHMGFSGGNQIAFAGTFVDSSSTGNFLIEITHSTTGTTRGVSAFEIYYLAQNSTSTSSRQILSATVYVTNNGINAGTTVVTTPFTNNSGGGVGALTISATHGATDLTTITIGNIASSINFRDVFVTAYSREIVSFNFVQQ
jgi:hypothetical protein